MTDSTEKQTALIHSLRDSRFHNWTPITALHLPNKPMHQTPLRGEQDRCNFSIQNQPDTCTDLSLAAQVMGKPLGAFINAVLL